MKRLSFEKLEKIAEKTPIEMTKDKALEITKQLLNCNKA